MHFILPFPLWVTAQSGAEFVGEVCGLKVGDIYVFSLRMIYEREEIYVVRWFLVHGALAKYLQNF